MAEKSRIEYIYEAKLAEQAERYDDMVKAITEVVKMEEELSVEERNLLSVAYKNVIGARRASWRIISSIEAKTEHDSSADASRKHSMAKTYRSKVEKELGDICDKILSALDEYLLSESRVAKLSNESHVFYYKMKGDYHRYKAEFMAGNEKDAEAKLGLAAYEQSSKLAESLSMTHPIRLGLALNFSVFHYEIMRQPQTACDIAKNAFDGAIQQLDNLDEDSYKDSTLIMQLLRDNLTLWTSDQEDEEKADDDDETEAN